LFVLTVKSITGKTIRLTDERWLHIVEGHPELAGHLNDVLFTVVDPDTVLYGATEELLAAVYVSPKKLLVVIYKENEVDGFIITAYFTSRIDKLLNRKILWQK
jgi:hypothetical protein